MKEINFPEWQGSQEDRPTYIGRNGSRLCVAVHVEEPQSGKIRIRGVNSKGLSQCYIEIPLDQVPEVVDAIQELVYLAKNP